MENLKRVPRGMKKENIPPPSGSYLVSGQRNEDKEASALPPRFPDGAGGMSHSGERKQRNIQENVNINLYLSAGSHITVSRHQAGSAVPESHRTGAQERLRASSVRNRAAKPLQHHLVQTNLSCPYWLFRDTTINPSSWQQSNLESKRSRLETVVPVGGSCPVSSKINPPNDLSYGSRDVPWTYDVTFKDRMGNKDQQSLKQPRGGLSELERRSGDLESNGESFSPTKLLGVPSLGCLHPDCRSPSMSPDRSVDSFPPGPALTLDHLSTSPLEKHPSSVTLQTLLRSSQTSAQLYNSIQRLKKEAATMGASSSFPWESKSSPLAYQPRSDPRIPTSALLSVMEQFAAEESYPEHASEKWRPPLSGGWGPGSTVGTLGDGEPSPVTYGYKNTGPYASPTEGLDGDWPMGFYGGVGSTTLAHQGEESYSSTSFCYLKRCSGVQQALEGKGICGCLKPHCHQRALDPEEPSSGVFRCSELGRRDLPMGLLSVDGLQVSLERLCAKTPVNMGVSVYDARREVHLTVRSPGGPEVIPSCQFGNTSEDLDICELREAGGAPFIANSVGEFAPFSPRPNLDPVGAAGLGEQSPFAGGTNNFIPARLVGERADGSLNPCSDRWPGVERGRREPPCCGEKDGGRDPVQRQNLEGDDGSMEAKTEDRPLPGRSDPVLAKCFMAWRDHVSEKQAAARALYECRLLRKGFCALQWAVQLRNVQVGVAQRSHALTVLSVSFHRWQDAAAKRQEARTLQQQQEMATSGKGLPAPLEKLRRARCPVLWQLSAEEMQDVARYSRAEGILWLQLRHKQGAEEELCRKAEAVRDVRRLAAFRLWRLQAERLDRAEARAQEARAVLEKKNLVAAFGMWRSRFWATRRMLPLAARVQRGLVSRCFLTWKEVTEREALSRHSLERRQAGSLRMCFQQWALMVRIREKAKQTLLELLTLKRRNFDVRLGLTRNAPLAQPCLNVARPSQRNGACGLEGLFRALALQKAFHAWKARWQQSQLANAFRRVLAQRQLREALCRWRWKAFSPSPLGLSSGDLVEDHLLALLDSEESSLSSGFHSNAPDPPISRGSLEKNQRQLLARCFALWSAWTRQTLQVKQHHRRSLLSRAFVSWSGAAACNSARRKARAEYEHAERQRLLASCFRRWKTELLKADQRRKEESPRRRPTGCRAIWRWRKATRGRSALRLNSVHQACNYWTKAAIFHQCVQQRICLVGVRKLTKMPLCWPSRQSRKREKRLDADLGTHSRLTCSSFHVWLTTYRCQSRALRPPESPDVAGRIVESGWTQENDMELAPAEGQRRLLERKYLRLWRHNILARRFQHARDTRHLARVWLSWKDACRAETVVRALAQQRLVEWSWKMWRRRCLQSWVAERFREAGERHLLKRAFERWQQLAAMSYTRGEAAV